MGLFIATVTGYMVVLLSSLGILIYYLMKGLDSSSSTTIDAKPTEEN